MVKMAWDRVEYFWILMIHITNYLLTYFVHTTFFCKPFLSSELWSRFSTTHSTVSFVPLVFRGVWRWHLTLSRPIFSLLSVTKTPNRYLHKYTKRVYLTKVLHFTKALYVQNSVYKREAVVQGNCGEAKMYSGLRVPIQMLDEALYQANSVKWKLLSHFIPPPARELPSTQTCQLKTQGAE